MPQKEVPGAIVESNRKFFSDDQTTRTLIIPVNAEGRSDNISYILKRQTSVSIRNYGAPGSLASISMHGTGSNHTQVTWNGIPVNSPTTGQADLSLIPSAFIQTVEVIDGASGSLFGSGTFGGSVNLNNEPDWKNRFTADYSLTAGSYGLRGHLLSVKAGSEKFQYHLSLISTKAENDFKYRDHYLYESPVIKNLHNAYRAAGILQNAFLKFNNRNYIETGFWYQQKSLEIPALMGSYKPSLAQQKDSVMRSFLSYRRTGSKYTLILRSSLFSDFLNYRDRFHPDSAYSIDSKIVTGRFLNEADVRLILLPRLIAGAGMSFNRITGKSNNYGGKVDENEYALYASVKYIQKNFIANAGIRNEYYEGLNPKPQYSLGVRYNLLNRFIVRLSYSTKFRKPTFNEKYWNPGGNPNLRPEKGRGGELTLEWKTPKDSKNKISLEAKTTGFFQTVDNWIQWVIQDSLTPVEYKKVFARGFEAWLITGYRTGITEINCRLNYNLNRSSIIKTFDNNAEFEGNQLIYVPQHTAGALLDILHRNLAFTTFASYTGPRETVETAIKDLRLPGFTIFDVSAGYQRTSGKLPFSINIGVNNVFNRSYEMIRSYALPGRTFHVTIRAGYGIMNKLN